MLEYSEFDYVVTFTGELYTFIFFIFSYFMLQISILSLQLEDLSSTAGMTALVMMNSIIYLGKSISSSLQVEYVCLPGSMGCCWFYSKFGHLFACVFLNFPY